MDPVVVSVLTSLCVILQCYLCSPMQLQQFELLLATTSAMLVDNKDDIMESNTIMVVHFMATSYKYFLKASHCPWGDIMMHIWYVKPRSLHWWENFQNWCMFDSDRFQAFLRLSRGLFDTLVQLSRDDILQGDIPSFLFQVQGQYFSTERKVAIALMTLGTGPRDRFRALLPTWQKRLPLIYKD
ncbi:hypothetical protein L7F22_069225 [Adiantum nelumboides]|nr:hypothetical protein [Adiantum nelumboides]